MSDADLHLTAIELGPLIAERAEALAHHTRSPYAEDIDMTLRALGSPQCLNGVLLALHQLQRLYLIHMLELEHDDKVSEAFYDHAHFPLWHQFAALEASEAQKDRLADLMYSGDPFKRSPILLVASDYGRGIAERVVTSIHNHNEKLDFWVDDALFQRRLLSVMTEAQAETYGNIMAQRLEVVERLISIAANNQSVEAIDKLPPKEIMTKYSGTYSDRSRQNTPNLFYTSTRLPTPQAAKLDGFDYADYVDLFFRMCDVDWDRIDAAHRVLIGKLNEGNILHITNDDGTDVTMDIGGFTFANSRVAKNVPGSEVFSAPRRDSVNGTIVAKGRFTPRDDSHIIEDITLVFENGRIIDYSAEKGIEYLTAAIETDEGSHYIGEIGIGTNPVLQRHVINSLMVEKIGGSFHVALGRAYEYTDYLGEPVKLDNGNRSKIHWDITTMLVGKSGMMFLDGKPIMSNGKFLDPELAYLNGE